jgi:hypothetical protein
MLSQLIKEKGIFDAVGKKMLFCYVIDLIMCDRASIKPLALSEDLDWENIDINPLLMWM